MCAGRDVVVENANHPHPAARLVDLLGEGDAVLVGTDDDGALRQAAAPPERGGDPPDAEAKRNDEAGHQRPGGDGPGARERPAKHERDDGDRQEAVATGAEDAGELAGSHEKVGRLVESLGEEDRAEHRHHDEHEPIAVIAAVDADAGTPDQGGRQPEGEEHGAQV